MGTVDIVTGGLFTGGEASGSTSSFEITTTMLVPDLQYWFNETVKDQTLTRNNLPIPTSINTLFFSPGSFIELLFNDSYSHTEYEYTYSSITSRSAWPEIVSKRLLIYPSTAIYLDCRSEGMNVFGLKSQDITLLNTLLQYRVDNTSVTIIEHIDDVLIDSTTSIDSTAVVFLDNTLYANYNNVSTNLAKLIFLYLDFKINGSISHYDTESIISSSDSIIENCFEAYLVSKIFDYYSARGT